MHFAQPAWLLLLLLIPVPLWLERARPRIVWPGLARFGEDRPARSWRRSLRFLPGLLRGLAIAAIGVALRAPQTVGGVTRITGQGVAIVVALDQSSSMRTEDFPADRDTRRISRLDAARETLVKFIEGRPDDLIGLVLFANYPDLAYAPTLDHRRLIETAQLIRVARPGDDGTNIGHAIDWSLGALRDTTPSKKVLILLTDGNNEPAGPKPRDSEQAAALGRDLGVVIHTIAIGRVGGIVRSADPGTDLPVMTEVEGPNVELLRRIAAVTGGRSFVATTADALDEVFQVINALEKSLVRSEVLTRYDEHFAPWAAAALGLLILDRLLASGWLRRLPWSALAETAQRRPASPDLDMDIIYRYDTQGTVLPRSIPDADAAIHELLDGHARYRRIVSQVVNELHHEAGPHEPLVIPSNPLSLNYAAVGAPLQVPFAVTLGVFGRRAPIERIFDQPPNALFVVRVAGNVLGSECLGSIEYAVHQLTNSMRLLVVLGHSGCGAVTAAVDSYLGPLDYPEVGFSHALRSLVNRIRIAVRGADRALTRAGGPEIQHRPGYREALIETAVYLNAALTAFDLRREIEATGAKDVRVVYGVFDLADQRVHSLPHHCEETDEPLFGEVPHDSPGYTELGERIVQAVRARGMI